MVCNTRGKKINRIHIKLPVTRGFIKELGSNGRETNMQKKKRAK